MSTNTCSRDRLCCGCGARRFEEGLVKKVLILGGELRLQTRNGIVLHGMKGENVRLRGLLYGKDLIKYDNSSDTHYTLREV